MEDLINRINALENISKELEPDEIARTSYNKEINKFFNRFIDSTEIEKAFKGE